MKYFILLTLIFSANILKSQKNTDYYSLINNAEINLIEGDMNTSLNLYLKALNKYEYPFIKDIVAATCVATYTKDTAVFYELLEKCLLRGLSKSELSYFDNKKKDDKRVKYFIKNYEYYRNKYVESIDKNRRMTLGHIDIRNQVNIGIGLKKYGKSHKEFCFHLDSCNQVLSDSLQNYIKLKNFPTEKQVGIGSPFCIVVSDDSLSVESDECTYEYLPYADYLRIKENDTVYFYYSYKQTFISNLRFRPIYSFLWHIDVKKPKIDSTLQSALISLRLDPYYYAACAERSNLIIDYAMAMESRVLASINFKRRKLLKLSKKKILLINEARDKIGIRSLENEVALFNKILILENLNQKKYDGRKRRGKNLFFKSLFLSNVP